MLNLLSPPRAPKIFIKGPNVSTCRELWVLLLKVVETGNRIFPAHDAGKELSDTKSIRYLVPLTNSFFHYLKN